ncbi:protein YhfH [Caldalkalibacillus salinus]|uniref:protein YhfH n=1 Tax=Caldalkalibacillus salinus TaxID=2803787 RepID=UPI00192155B9|nr:protein YhfH [Caldalkalibacillus salinus]
MSPFNDHPSKVCTECQQEMLEMFDCYSNVCPECSLEDHVLVNAAGVWTWQRSAP